MRSPVIALAVGALLLNGSPAHALGWTTVPSPSQIPGSNFLYGADSSSPTNVWAVGGVFLPTGGTSHSIALRHDGNAWRQMPRTGLPGNDSLRGVDAVSASDVWAVGDYRFGVARAGTLAAHWNGSAWTPEPTPNGNPASINTLNGVAVAGGSVWAVGTYVDANNASNRRKLILQRTNGTWRTSTAPTVATYESLAAVDATGASDVWAVGSATSDIRSAPLTPLVLRWNGTRWTSMTLPAPAGTALTGVDARTPNDVWAVGTSGSQPYIAHFDGTTWRRVSTPAVSGQLADVVALSPSAAVAVGRSDGAPLILRWNGSSWVREAVPAVSSNPFLTAAAPAGTSSAWAIGYRFEFNAYANRTLTLRGA